VTVRARLLVVAAAVCFATTGTAQALGAPEVSPVAVGASRVVLGGALLALVALAGQGGRGRPRGRGGRRPGPAAGPGTWRASWPLVAVAALGVAAYQPTFFAGVRSTGVAVGTLVALGSAPVVTGLVDWALTGRRPGRRWAAATALACAGVGVLGGGTAQVRPAGVLAALAAGAAYAAYTLASKRLLARGWGPDAVMGAAFGAAAVLLLPVLLAAGTRWLGTPAGAATAVFLAVVPTAVAYLLFARGLAVLPAAEVATLTLVEPVTAALLGVLVLAEAASASTATGALVLLAGLAVLAAPVRLSGRRRAGARPRADT